VRREVSGVPIALGIRQARAAKTVEAIMVVINVVPLLSHGEWETTFYLPRTELLAQLELWIVSPRI
jgi:hypothetical protein